VVIEDREGENMRPMLMLVAHGVPTGREAEVKANLTLAAQSPNLYAALLDLSDGTTRDWTRKLKAARAALAKARGEKP
jgi:hypothetical protein